MRKLLCLLLVLMSVQAFSSVKLQKQQVVIVNMAGDSRPIQRAIASLQTDVEKVMGFQPAIVSQPERGKVSIWVVNDAVDEAFPSLKERFRVNPLPGEEEHEVFADARNKRIVLHGHDMRGTIFAIYTFTEQVLGVPPLWYFCDWQPTQQTSITTDINFHAASPQVRFRAWFPNDTDMFTPWRKQSKENDERWLEAMLRLKLNCVELETTVTYPDYRMTDEAQMVSDFGIILTSHHHVALNNSFARWDDYWREVRHEEPHKPSINRPSDLIDFWRYNAETVHRSGIENLWQVTFRGRGDQPFWAFFDDAPKSDEERGKVITQMMQIQLDIIKEVTGEQDPYVRTTFYDEMSNLLAQGYIQPPKGKNMIWTYVAARRDHYPNDDVVQFDSSLGVKLGYYFNYQFTSTGSHLAACEGPWKMEFNYRYVNSKCPLLFSVVNAGNLREHLTELSANAAMMWDFDAYDTDRWLQAYCAQYFGQENAIAVAQLFRDYYNAYWQPKPTEFPGLGSRQFNFQDMRYARCMDQILGKFWEYKDNPLQDIGFESVKGRSFRIQGTNQVDTLIKNMEQTAQRFDHVSLKALNLADNIPVAQKTFYYDAVQAPATFMAHISHSLLHFMQAYRGQQDRDFAREHLTQSLGEMEKAKATLYNTHHGVFSEWYTHEYLFGMNGKINGIKGILPQKTVHSLVPTTPSTAPDYYCTWNLQGYVTSYGTGAGSNDLRLEINEDNLFGERLGYKVWGKSTPKTTLSNDNPRRKVTWTVDPRYQGWLNHYPMLHGDLTFVMDDSWDIPRGPDDDGASKRPHGRNYDNEYLATMAIDATRFPSFQGDDQQRMTQLVKTVKELGWRSLGGWVCAQDPIGLTHEYTGMQDTYENSLRWSPEQEERYWKHRLAESERAGFNYWKVDWGNKDRDEHFRRRLSQWAQEVAPHVTIEHASFQDGGTHHPDFISFSPVIRSYDVNNQIAQAQTLQRLYDLGRQADAEREGWGIINCEDEPYIAAGLGCAIGVMRHPYVGSLPNGQPDSYFADLGPQSRRLKNRLNEIVRAVRWHRIAQPFGHKHDQWHSDSVLLSESGGGRTWEAPARISRQMPLPEIIGEEASSPLRPYLAASLYDNGCTALAIINRNINGVYQQQRVDVRCQPQRWDCKIGIFGFCRTLTLTFNEPLPSKPFKIYAQDLVTDESPTAIPYTLSSDRHSCIIQGVDLEGLCQGHDYPYDEVVREASKDYSDLSDPAIVLQIIEN